jgi:transcriptional regulator NrdR family protein
VFDRHDHAISVSAVAERRSTVEPAPRAVGELVMEALSTVDPVAYIRIGVVYRHFREAQRILGSSSGGSRRMTIKGGYGCRGFL